MIKQCLALIAFLGLWGCSDQPGLYGVFSRSSRGRNYSAAETLEEKENHYHAVVSFSLDGSEVREADKALLIKVSDRLIADRGSRVYVDGYTCELGGAEYNIALGFRRARAVADAMIAQGVRADQLILLSYGKEKPVDDQHTEAAWQKNRRVEVSLMHAP
jgi:peptidoglycan-associated lipoprotein